MCLCAGNHNIGLPMGKEIKIDLAYFWNILSWWPLRMSMTPVTSVSYGTSSSPQSFWRENL
jgi:hypothetical protein